MHKSAPTNVITYLKRKNRPAANGSADHKNSQKAKIKENISSSATSKIAVIDIENKTDRQMLFHFILRI
jgi:hypothetical protein